MRNFGFWLLVTSFWLLIIDTYFVWLNARGGELIDVIGALFLFILFNPAKCFFVSGVCALAVSMYHNWRVT